MRALVKINLREIQLSKSRPTLPETVNALAESMRASGLINPIIVKAAVIYDGAIMVQGYKVVAGNHRVSAARALEWQDIEAFVDDGDELHAELLEIDENLLRAEFTPAQRAVAIHRRKEIWEAIHPELVPDSGINSRGRGRPVEFATDTARATNENPKRTREHLARAEALGPDLHAVVGTSLDKGVELDALKEIPADQRRELIERAQAGEQVSARDYSSLTVKDDPASAQAERLVSIVLGDFTRMLGKVSPDDIAEAVSKYAINPDLKPYIEAVYTAFRAKRRAA